MDEDFLLGNRNAFLGCYGKIVSKIKVQLSDFLWRLHKTNVVYKPFPKCQVIRIIWKFKYCQGNSSSHKGLPGKAFEVISLISGTKIFKHFSLHNASNPMVLFLKKATGHNVGGEPENCWRQTPPPWKFNLWRSALLKQRELWSFKYYYLTLSHMVFRRAKHRSNLHRFAPWCARLWWFHVASCAPTAVLPCVQQWAQDQPLAVAQTSPDTVNLNLKTAGAWGTGNVCTY